MANPFADKPRGTIAEIARELNVSWPTAEKLLLRGEKSAQSIADRYEERVKREAEDARARMAAFSDGAESDAVTE